MTEATIAPQRAAANSSAIHSTRLTSQTATTSPWPMPCAASHAAVCSTFPENSARETGLPSNTKAGSAPSAPISD
ncbi:hypothetical protein ACVWXQ_004737 [Bradyrhizobium sp. S3.14.4]